MSSDYVSYFALHDFLLSTEIFDAGCRVLRLRRVADELGAAAASWRAGHVFGGPEGAIPLAVACGVRARYHHRICWYGAMAASCTTNALVFDVCDTKRTRYFIYRFYSMTKPIASVPSCS